MSYQQDFVPRTLYTASSDPTIEPEGSVYYNTTDDVVKKSDGSVWTVVGSAPTQRTFAFFVS